MNELKLLNLFVVADLKMLILIKYLNIYIRQNATKDLSIVEK